MGKVKIDNNCPRHHTVIDANGNYYNCSLREFVKNKPAPKGLIDKEQDEKRKRVEKEKENEETDKGLAGRTVGEKAITGEKRTNKTTQDISVGISNVVDLRNLK